MPLPVALVRLTLNMAIPKDDAALPLVPDLRLSGLDSEEDLEERLFGGCAGLESYSFAENTLCMFLLRISEGLFVSTFKRGHKNIAIFKASFQQVRLRANARQTQQSQCRRPPRPGDDDKPVTSFCFMIFFKGYFFIGNTWT